jgi:hypothetical protein
MYPTPEQIKAARLAANMTQAEAAAVVHRTSSTGFKRWSEWECGAKKMPPAEWELFNLKVARGISIERPERAPKEQPGRVSKVVAPGRTVHRVK